MAASRIKIGVQLQPHHAEIGQLRSAWCQLDELGIDSLWLWDHFLPLGGDPAGKRYEAWTLLAAMASETQTCRVGTLVSSVAYRNPDLLALMASTVNELSDGRVVLGVGAGWFEADYREFGYDFGHVGDRSRGLSSAVPRIKSRLEALGSDAGLPVLVGGGGERVTLRVAAQYADIWNTFGPARLFQRKNRILDEWCAKVGRDPAAIERSVLMMQPGFDVDELAAAGVEHVIVSIAPPYDLEPVRALLAAARG